MKRCNHVFHRVLSLSDVTVLNGLHSIIVKCLAVYHSLVYETYLGTIAYNAIQFFNDVTLKIYVIEIFHGLPLWLSDLKFL